MIYTPVKHSVWKEICEFFTELDAIIDDTNFNTQIKSLHKFLKQTYNKNCFQNVDLTKFNCYFNQHGLNIVVDKNTRKVSFDYGQFKYAYLTAICGLFIIKNRMVSNCICNKNQNIIQLFLETRNYLRNKGKNFKPSFSKKDKEIFVDYLKLKYID